MYNEKAEAPNPALFSVMDSFREERALSQWFPLSLFVWYFISFLSQDCRWPAVSSISEIPVMKPREGWNSLVVLPTIRPDVYLLKPCLFLSNLIPLLNEEFIGHTCISKVTF